MAEVKWLDRPEEQDYPAAQNYLELIYSPQSASIIVDQLKKAPISHFKAKDILRASGLSRLGISNSHVDKDRDKINKEKPLSPLLLLRDYKNGKVHIADGYHRMCAVYSVDEDATIP